MESCRALASAGGLGLLGLSPPCRCNNHNPGVYPLTRRGALGANLVTRCSNHPSPSASPFGHGSKGPKGVNVGLSLQALFGVGQPER